MTTGIRSKGVDLDSIFAPYVQGTSPAATGIKHGGVDINTRYAPLTYGTAAAATGITCRPGGSGSLVDLSTLFAAFGTTSYNLPINGTSYSDYVIRFEASIKFLMANNGTYQITNHAGTVLASGYWLPSGETVSNYTCYFSTNLLNSTNPDGSYTTYTTTAATQQPLTSSQYLSGGCAAVLVNNIVVNSGYISMHLYRSSVLQFITTINVTTSSSYTTYSA